jgi:hypothetical protein
MFISCNKNDLNNNSLLCDKITCTGKCIKTLENVEGFTVFASCFDKWGFYYKEKSLDAGQVEYNVIVIPDNWDKKYQQDSLKIKVCGRLIENDWPLIMPDPGFGESYRMEVDKVEIIE